jgi:hypothetical protein
MSSNRCTWPKNTKHLRGDWNQTWHPEEEEIKWKFTFWSRVHMPPLSFLWHVKIFRKKISSISPHLVCTKCFAKTNFFMAYVKTQRNLMQNLMLAIFSFHTNCIKRLFFLKPPDIFGLPNLFKMHFQKKVAYAPFLKNWKHMHLRQRLKTPHPDYC